MRLPDLQFNELSCTPLATDAAGARERVQSVIDTFKELSLCGVRGIRCSVPIDQISLTATEHLNDFFNRQDNRPHANYLRPLLRYPFIEDADPHAAQYAEWGFTITLNGEKQTPSGLAAAYLQSALAVGFPSCDFWRNHAHTLSVTRGAGTEDMAVICLSLPTHVQTQEVRDWITRHTPESPLKESVILPEEKRIHLRDDHGKDKLSDLARRLTQSPYVIEVINSLPFNPSAHDRIGQCHPDGKIELRIPIAEDDRGLGVIVQTTGGTLSETERIAEKLRNM
jgi:hypothetical protein